ncbi:MAG: acetylglutamate kinase [Alphaproteobacteria bacterium]|nr:acetylglutamate kinase [Alphaproteobacteria bacterium]MBL6782937.1 acetylglutamate kinase [Alphaproteobacteria bacterium]
MESITQSNRMEWLAKAGILAEALPYMRRYSGHAIVVKFGGHAMGDDAYIRNFAEDMVLLRQVGAKPVVVHGGGPQIGAMLEKLNITSDFINGLRVTDADTVSVVEMVLSGAINKSLVAAINDAGAKGVGISGKDADLIKARKLLSQNKTKDGIERIDLGFVGEPEAIDTSVINALIASDLIPVIAPVARGADGSTYNINADTASGAISAAMQATRLLLLSDVPGVMDKDGQVIPDITISQAKMLIENGTISGGMIPKVNTCIEAVEGGAEAAVILDGREAHAVLVELFTEHGIGTIIKAD